MTKQDNHDAATIAWDDYEAHRAKNDKDRRAANPSIILPPRHGRAKSPVAGMGERTRAERAAAGALSAAEMAKAKATRFAKQKFLQDQAKKTLADNLRPYVRPTDNSRYFPHQGKLECERRVRQMGRVVLAQAAE